MELVIRISALAVISAACALLIKKASPDISYGVSVITAVLLCLAGLSVCEPIGELISGLIADTGLSPAVFQPVLKCVAIAVAVKLVSGLCKDAGQSAAAVSVEYCGCAAALLVSLPLIRTVLELLEGLA